MVATRTAPVSEQQKYVHALKVEVAVRTYKESDRIVIARMFEDFQDFLASVDTLRRLVRKEALVKERYGNAYLQKTLEKVSSQDGIFYVAESRGRIVGFVVGIIIEPSKTEEMELGEKRLHGEILELYLEPRYRGNGLGKKLMETAEAYFKGKGCKDSTLLVFEPNASAHEFYLRRGYGDRSREMLKVL